MSGKTKGWATLTAAFALAGMGLAQGISVNVNGQPVTFTSVGPQQINGRVMVPLRGVMEKLGAYVGYDAGSRTVTATRGDIDLQLRLGQRTATLNGRQVTLDVPAMEYRGSTLVPLRFMGEALGVDVRWDGTQQAVNITTDSADTGRPLPIDPNQGTTPRQVEISSFTMDREGYLRPGSEVTFTLEGTPGANATLQIPGVTQEVKMTEVSPGRYQAKVLAPAEGVTVNKAAAIARLRSGTSERLIQAAGNIAVDTVVPKITETSPAPDSRTSSAQPNITVAFDDGSGSGIATDRIRITLDGRDVTSDASVTSSFLAYRPPTALQPGKHEVVVTAEDRAGNTVSRTWSFNIGRRANIIQSFTSTAGANPEPGDVIRFTLVGEAGGTATYSIGNRRDLPMREVAPGRYEAEYTVRRNDDMANEEIRATLRTREGETYNSEPRTDLTGSRQGVVRKPVVTSPVPDDRLTDQFRVTGTAPRNTQVRIKVDYRASLLGVVGTGGTVSEQTVQTDAEGRWESQPIRLSGFATGRGTTYTITVTTIGRNGRESEPVVINARR